MNAGASPARSASATLISPLVLERPGAWRPWVIAALFLVAISPGLPLLAEVVTTTGSTTHGGIFAEALGNSLLIALLAAVTALVPGILIGVLLTLYDLPGRRLLLVVLALPLLLPPFLIALGGTMLAGPRLTGLAGTVPVFGLWTLPLVAFAAHAAGSGLPATAIEAARLAGGELRVFALMVRYVFVPALAAAGLGAALSIADPGPGQVFRLTTAASEILTSFAALNDFGLAARQSLQVAAVILIAAGPLAWFVAPRMAEALMARETRQARRRPWRGPAAFAMEILLLAVVLVPIVGLASPLVTGNFDNFARALSEVARTAGNTVLYAAGAGLIAVFAGFTLAAAVGRDTGRRRFAIAACLFILCLPPALAGLGMIYMATAAPAWADPILRSRFALCLVLGLRFFPVAAIFALRSWASAAPSWTFAAAVHGIPLMQFLARILLPHLFSAATAAFLVGGLLAIADIGTTLLLHPPGAASFPLALFTVMANAPEALVASMALVHVGIAAAFLFALQFLLARWFA